MKAIDLFCGCGGIRSGFSQSFEDLEFVFSSEIDKYAKISYEANFKEKPHGDITKISNEEIPSHDLLLAGFPCQPFSSAGKGLGFADTRGTLFFEIERILAFHKPKVIFLENVKALTTHDNCKTFQVIKESLKKLGYNIFYKVLNSKDFGIPQNRARIFIVGFLDHSIKFEFPKETFKKTRVGDILEQNVDLKYTITDKAWQGHITRKANNSKSINKKGFGYGSVNENTEYTRTITARYYKDGSEILVEQEGKNPRRLTPREAANLQAFPKDFKIVVSDAQAYKQFGNSVTVSIINLIGNQIKKAIYE